MTSEREVVTARRRADQRHCVEATSGAAPGTYILRSPSDDIAAESKPS